MCRLGSITVIMALMAGQAFGQTLDRIRETGEMKLGFRTDAAPISYLDEDGEPAGYSPRVCAGVAEDVAAQLGLEELNATFYPVDVEDRFDAVANGEIDLLCGAATITLERMEQVSFSTPTYVDGAAVLLPAGEVADLTAMAEKKIGVREGTTTQTSLERSLEAMNLTADVTAFASHDEGLAAMEAGEIGAYFADQSILFSMLFKSDAAEGLEVSDQTLTIEKQGLAFARGDEDFRVAVDRAISGLYASGQMERIFIETMPGATPGLALRAMHLIAPTIP